jgi:hypothetical protein
MSTAPADDSPPWPRATASLPKSSRELVETDGGRSGSGYGAPLMLWPSRDAGNLSRFQAQPGNKLVRRVDLSWSPSRSSHSICCCWMKRTIEDLQLSVSRRSGRRRTTMRRMTLSHRLTKVRFNLLVMAA